MTSELFLELLVMPLLWLHVAAAAVWFGATMRLLMVGDRLASASGGGPVALSHGGGLWVVAAPAGSDAWRHPFLPLRWSAYLTCLAGSVLLVRGFYLEPALGLVGPGHPWPASWMAVGAAVAGLVVGYLVYELLCSAFARLPPAIRAGLWGTTLVLVGLGWAALFPIRAALLHAGVLLATCLAANVGHHVVPCESRIRRAVAAGLDPDTACLRRARERAWHNAYAMPVVLGLMLVGNAPLALPPRSLVAFLAGLVASGFAVTDLLAHWRHRPRRARVAATALAAGLVLLLWATRPVADPPGDAAAEAALSQVRDIVARRCLACHAGTAPAGGLALDRPDLLAQNARAVALAAGFGRSMPPGNATGMTDEERRLLRRWSAARGSGDGG